MSLPVVADTTSFFYPVGNTPAVHLTRGLPHKQPADILLLGCGDVRNILFTAYVDQGSGRKLDVTCCDLQPAIIARNILLLTLILDDVDGSNDTPIWNIYYHLSLDDRSLKVLSCQAHKLHSLAGSMQSWHCGKYGQQLRFCNERTLRKTREIWDTYRIEYQDNASRTRSRERANTAMERAKSTRVHFTGGACIVLSGMRSAAPACFPALKDVAKIHKFYWDHGSTVRNQTDDPPTMPNPMFVTDHATIHYGTDPLLGFHLATAYTPLTAKSPLYCKAMKEDSSMFKVVKAARMQFRSWAKAFREYPSQHCAVRFITADALAFCYALQQKQNSGNSQHSGFYTDAYHHEPLILDGEDYLDSGSAPMAFCVIDTSNLTDHLGALNIIVATVPLLACGSSSSLYTESLVKRDESHVTYADTLLNGPLPTISSLMGLLPLEYYTNCTTFSTVDDSVLESGIFAERADGMGGQMPVRMTWKLSLQENKASSKMHVTQLSLDDIGCARILHGVYLAMFQHENVRLKMSAPNGLTLSNMSLLRYNRGSFVLFLRFVRSRVIVEWDKVMRHLIQLIKSDSSLPTGPNYFQELYLLLHVFNVYSMDTFSRTFLQRRIDAVGDSGGLKGWRDIPPVLCVTIKVPRERLHLLTGSPEALDTPIVHWLLQSSPVSQGGAWQNTFSTVQLSFGDLSTTGTRFSDTFKINVREDEARWAGTSALLVSFQVPTWILLLEPENATAGFGVEGTPQGVMRFFEALGPEMLLYKTTLANKENVFLSRYPPNQPENTELCTLKISNIEEDTVSLQSCRTVCTANVDSVTSEISSVTGRLELLSEDLFSALKGEGKVETVQTSPCTFIETIHGMTKSASTRLVLDFPTPVLSQRSKTRIARKSCYIEVEAPLAGSSGWKHMPSFMFPTLLETEIPTAWNMPHLNLDCLPVIDISNHGGLQWLNTHIGGMFSSRERELREREITTASAPYNDVRVSFKDSLFSMFMHFTGLQGDGRTGLFTLNNPSDGGVHILLFVLCAQARRDQSHCRLGRCRASTDPRAHAATPTDVLIWTFGLELVQHHCRQRRAETLEAGSAVNG